MLFTSSAPSLAGSPFAFASEQEVTHSRQQPSHCEAPPLPSESLLKGRKIVEIEHNGYLYKLQATKLGKLILTK